MSHVVLLAVVFAVGVPPWTKAELGQKETLPSQKTYRVVYLPAAKVQIDGRVDEPSWKKAQAEKGFVFPWRNEAAPSTEFRALCDAAHLYFAFRVKDSDIVVLDTLRDKEDVVFEDRAEMFFSVDDRMENYYCIEVDCRGRAFDYQASYYRQINPKWNWKGLLTKATTSDEGYVVEGRIPLESLETMGFPRLRPGVNIRCGLYRAEFSHDRSGRPVVRKESIHNRGRKLDDPLPIEKWISWVNPKTQTPDFHVPTSLGWLDIVEGK